MQTLVTRHAAETQAPAKRRAAGGLEFVSVLAIAFAAFLLHQCFFGMPNITLTFDGEGFLVVANGWVHALRPELWERIAAYAGHGFREIDRLALVQYVGPAYDIVKQGPLMPLILALPYLIAHKPAVNANWQIAMVTMYLVQAITVALMWLVANRCWGRAAARAVAIVSIFYAGFVINGGRALSEMPACAATMLAAWVVIELCCAEQRAAARRYNLGAVGAGFALALMTLARPTLLPLPIIIAGVLFAASKVTQTEIPYWRSTLVAVVTGAILCLAPWCATKFVLTGHPSITIDRYGAYNLLAGMDTSTDGMDLVSTGFVAHPDQFKMPIAEVLSRTYHAAAADPVAFVDMMLRKPSRLIDSPWNEFSVASWMLPFELQKWWHQFLFLLAAVGLFELVARAHRSRSFATMVPPAILGTIVVYHFVNCLFIANRRYMFTAMPALIVLAIGGAFATRRAIGKRSFQSLALATAALPTACLVVDCLSGEQHPLLPLLAANVGIDDVSLLTAGTVGAIALIWCVAVYSLLGSAWRHPTGGKAPICATWLAFAGIVSVCCFATTYRSLKTMEFNYPLTEQNRLLTVQIALPHGDELRSRRFFILADCHSDHPGAIRQLKASINEHPVAGEFQPLFAIDQSQHENLMYECTVSASGGREVEANRQWWCLPIDSTTAAHTLTGDHAALTLSNQATDGSNIYAAADFFTPGAKNHELSITEFSWTKGFMANNPGEMRMDVWRKADGHGRPTVQPRIYLLAVEQHSEETNNNVIATTAKAFPDTIVSHELAHQMTRFTVKTDGLDVSQGPAVKITVRGAYRSIKSKSSEASVCLVEHLSVNGVSKEELSPLAPLALHATPTWQIFEFNDYRSGGGTRGGAAQQSRPPLHAAPPLQSVDTLVLGRQWYEALQYGTVRPRDATQFKGLKISMAPACLPDLKKDRWEIIRPEAVSPQ